MTICKKRLAPLALALLLAFGLIVGAAPVSADAANEHVIEFLDVIGRWPARICSRTAFSPR